MSDEKETPLDIATNMDGGFISDKAMILLLKEYSPTVQLLKNGLELDQTNKVVEISQGIAAVVSKKMTPCLMIASANGNREVIMILSLLKALQVEVKQKQIKVIVISKFSEDSLIEKFREYGCQDFITEPITQKTLEFKLALHISALKGWRKKIREDQICYKKEHENRGDTVWDTLKDAPRVTADFIDRKEVKECTTFDKTFKAEKEKQGTKDFLDKRENRQGRLYQNRIRPDLAQQDQIQDIYLNLSSPLALCVEWSDLIYEVGAVANDLDLDNVREEYGKKLAAMLKRRFGCEELTLYRLTGDENVLVFGDHVIQPRFEKTVNAIRAGSDFIAENKCFGLAVKDSHGNHGAIMFYANENQKFEVRLLEHQAVLVMLLSAWLGYEASHELKTPVKALAA